MIYKNKKNMMILLLIGICVFLYFTYQFKEIEYRVFGTIVVIWSSILYVFAIFEYYKIDDEKIIHVYRLGYKTDEIYWKDVNRIFIFSDSYVKGIRIDCVLFSGSSMVINSGIKGYNELVKTIIDKIKDNPNISIDQRLDKFLK